MDAGFDQPHHVGAVMDTTFADDQLAERDPFRQA